MEESLEERMQGYNDIRIINTLKQSDRFPEESVKVAEKIALKRGLANEQQIDDYKNFVRIRKQAEQYIKEGVEPKELFDIMIDRHGYSSKIAGDAVAAASKHATKQSWRGTGGAMTIGTVAIIIFFVIRMIIRLMRD